MRGRTAPRIVSAGSDAATPAPMITRSRNMRAVTTETEPIRPSQPIAVTNPLPAAYSLPPTIPRPFTGTLDASLDAILFWGTQFPNTQRIVDTLLRPSTGVRARALGRLLLEEVLVLVTRTLLPEQVAGNRDALARMYERRKQLAIRLVLRYDMLRGWKVDGRWSGVCVASLPPTLPQIRGDKESGRRELGLDSSMDVEGKASSRRPFMPNIISTLIAAPHDGWTTRAVYDRMKHHVTGLDTYLLLSDEEIEAWSDQTLLNMTSQVILQWQWLRRNNDILEDMEVHGYAELDGKADDNEWIADDIKRPEWGKGVKDHTVNTEKGIPKMGDEVD